jgi:protein-tyrosine-phosphatase
MLELDYSYQDTWERRKIALGGITYKQYLESQHWKEVKTKAKSRPNYQKCEFCESTKIDLHHTSYKWIGTKDELRCIIALCRKHHQEVHDLAKEKKTSVRLATNELRKVYKPDYTKPNRSSYV